LSTDIGFELRVTAKSVAAFGRSMMELLRSISMSHEKKAWSGRC
jgi:hypothetical protein